MRRVGQLLLVGDECTQRVEIRLAGRHHRPGEHAARLVHLACVRQIEEAFHLLGVHAACTQCFGQRCLALVGRDLPAEVVKKVGDFLALGGHQGFLLAHVVGARVQHDLRERQLHGHHVFLGHVQVQHLRVAVVDDGVERRIGAFGQGEREPAHGADQQTHQAKAQRHPRRYLQVTEMHGVFLWAWCR